MKKILPQLKKIKNKNKYTKSNCAELAQVFKDKHGGDLYIIGNFPSQKFWHIVVKRKGKYWDINGPKTKKAIKKKYPSLNLRKATSKDEKEIKKILNKKVVEDLRKNVLN
jgi:hypothetical protein